MGRGTHKSPSTFGELLAPNWELAVFWQEEFYIWSFIYHSCNSSLLEGNGIFLWWAKRNKSVFWDVEFLGQIVFSKWAYLESYRLVAGYQGINSCYGWGQLLDSENWRQACSVAWIDDQNHKKPDYQHNATKWTNCVFSCKQYRSRFVSSYQDTIEYVSWIKYDVDSLCAKNMVEKLNLQQHTKTKWSVNDFRHSREFDIVSVYNSIIRKVLTKELWLSVSLEALETHRLFDVQGSRPLLQQEVKKGQWHPTWVE